MTRILVSENHIWNLVLVLERFDYLNWNLGKPAFGICIECRFGQPQHPTISYSQSELYNVLSFPNSIRTRQLVVICYISIKFAKAELEIMLMSYQPSCLDVQVFVNSCLDGSRSRLQELVLD